MNEEYIDDLIKTGRENTEKMVAVDPLAVTSDILLETPTGQQLAGETGAAGFNTSQLADKYEVFDSRNKNIFNTPTAPASSQRSAPAIIPQTSQVNIPSLHSRRSIFKTASAVSSLSYRAMSPIYREMKESDNLGMEAAGKTASTGHKATNAALSAAAKLERAARKAKDAARVAAAAARRSAAAASGAATATATASGPAGWIVAVAAAVLVLFLVMAIFMILALGVFSVVAASSTSTSGLYWPLEMHYVYSKFGERPIIKTPRGNSLPFHYGIDITVPGGNSFGASIGASSGGTVLLAGVNGGYGNCVIIEHEDGTQTKYGHMHEIYVSSGDTVFALDIIGTVGSTGTSTGPHLHFEVIIDGVRVDPESVGLKEWGEREAEIEYPGDMAVILKSYFAQRHHGTIGQYEKEPCDNGIWLRERRELSQDIVSGEKNCSLRLRQNNKGLLFRPGEVRNL